MAVLHDYRCYPCGAIFEGAFETEPACSSCGSREVQQIWLKPPAAHTRGTGKNIDATVESMMASMGWTNTPKRRELGDSPAAVLPGAGFMPLAQGKTAEESGALATLRNLQAAGQVGSLGADDPTGVAAVRGMFQTLKTAGTPKPRVMASDGKTIKVEGAAS